MGAHQIPAHLRRRHHSSLLLLGRRSPLFCGGRQWVGGGGARLEHSAWRVPSRHFGPCQRRRAHAVLQECGQGERGPVFVQHSDGGDQVGGGAPPETGEGQGPPRQAPAQGEGHPSGGAGGSDHGPRRRVEPVAPPALRAGVQAVGGRLWVSAAVQTRGEVPNRAPRLPLSSGRPTQRRGRQEQAGEEEEYGARRRRRRRLRHSGDGLVSRARPAQPHLCLRGRDRAVG
mmetsp:Transcript_30681/g.61419  ORF Transcript_30681/g.61419 Transcript_30681/m.61419 type:complete len:229 (+) Transcript_30681:548-1234(+)